MVEDGCIPSSGILLKNSTLDDTESNNCRLCGFLFANIEALQDHILSEHSTAMQQIHSCPICQKSFTQLSNLRTHSRVHTGERPFSCSECDRTFTNKVNMKTHARTHTGERPFVCETCHKQFTQVSSLRVHVRLHTGDRPYHCHLCSWAFSKSSDLQRHLKTHGDRQSTRRVASRQSSPAVSAALFVCFVCDRQFTKAGILKVHLRTHTGDGDEMRCSGATVVESSTMAVESEVLRRQRRRAMRAVDRQNDRRGREVLAENSTQ